jgi:hypothetical protein
MILSKRLGDTMAFEADVHGQGTGCVLNGEKESKKIVRRE